MIFKENRAQSTLEYVIILAVVIGIVVAAGEIFKSNIKSAYDAAYKR
jgi:uncharacterized protein (UPF0333 family)